MRGSIKQRSQGSWTIRIELDRKPDGSRNQKTTTVRGTKREAEKELARLLVEAERGTIATSGRMTVADLADRWLTNHVIPNLTPKTAEVYGDVVRRYIVPDLGKLPLDKLRQSHILAWQSQLRERKLAANTLRNYCAVLSHMLATGVKWKLLATNPATGLDLPKKPVAAMHAFTPEQAAQLLAATGDSLSWRAFFTLAITTGMRVGELKGLRWSDVDLGKQFLVVTQIAQAINGQGIITKPPKTAGSRRRIALSSDVVQLLRQHKAAQNEQRLARGAAWQHNDLVFVGRNGQPLQDTTIFLRFKRTCQAAGVPVIRIHDLRHTAATLMLTAGVHPKVVSERLGHSNIAITLQTYSHVSETLQRQAADVLETLLKNGDQSVINR